MLTLDEVHKLNSSNTDLDEYIKTLDKVDYYDNDLIRLRDRFKKINPKEYFLSYSGGKDSHFLYWFIKEYLQNTNIEIVGVNTYMEHHEILKRINKNCDRVLFPKLKPFEIKEKYGIPCFSKFQDEMIERYQKGSRTKNTMAAITGEGRITFKLNKKARELLLSNQLHKISNKCCKVIKKDTMKAYQKETGKKAIIGVRGDESSLRKAQYTSCFTKIGNFTPLWDITEDIMNEVYKRYNIEIPKVYEHINRTGCMGCPYGKKNTEKELALINENQRKFVCEYFKESYEVLGINTKQQMTLDELLEKESE